MEPESMARPSLSFISYDYHLILQAGTHYSVLSQLTFTLASVPTKLPVDLKSQGIQKVVVNGHETPLNYSEGFVFLEVSKLMVGQNHVAIQYRNLYDNDGRGLVSFIDVDYKQYLYANFGSYYANRVFARFDQSDLKVPMRLSLIFPKIWKVLSNEIFTATEEVLSPEKYIDKAKSHDQNLLKKFITGTKQGKMLLLEFETKQPQTFVAGEYLEFQGIKTTEQIPIKLYCIQSSLRCSKMKELTRFILEITVDTLKYFQQILHSEYPFQKFFILFIPSSINPKNQYGLTLLNHRFLNQETLEISKLTQFGIQIAKSIAEQWINTISPKSQIDQRLHQCLAYFLSYMFYEHQAKYTNGRLDKIQFAKEAKLFFTCQKFHIEATKSSLHIMMLNGFYLWKQLRTIILVENFNSLLVEFLKTKRGSFMEYLESQKKRLKNLRYAIDIFKPKWINIQKVSQLTKFESIFMPKTKDEFQIKIIEENTSNKNYHHHIIKIALFSTDTSCDTFDYLITNKTELQQKLVISSDKYEAILSNVQDEAFGKYYFDIYSLNYFSRNLFRITDPNYRVQIFISFLSLVQDGQFQADTFICIMKKCLLNQQSNLLFSTYFDVMEICINMYMPIKFREEFYDQIFSYILRSIPKNSNNNPRIIILQSKLIKFALSQDAKKKMIQWYNGTLEELKGHDMTVDQQWSTVAKAFTLKDLSLEEKEKLFEVQAKKDPSDKAKNYRFTCDALKATKEEFEKIYNSFKINDNTMSITNKHYLAKGWAHSFHSEWLLEYKFKYFADIPTLASKLEGGHFELFYKRLAPIDDDLIGQIREFKNIKFVDEKAQRDILKMVENLRKRKKAYKLWSQRKVNL